MIIFGHGIGIRVWNSVPGAKTLDPETNNLAQGPILIGCCDMSPSKPYCSTVVLQYAQHRGPGVRKVNQVSIDQMCQASLRPYPQSAISRRQEAPDERIGKLLTLVRGPGRKADPIEAQ